MFGLITTKVLAYACGVLLLAAGAFGFLWRYQCWQTKAWKAEAEKRDVLIAGYKADLASATSAIREQNSKVEELAALGRDAMVRAQDATRRQGEIRAEYEQRIRMILLETPPKEPAEALEWLRKRLEEERVAGGVL